MSETNIKTLTGTVHLGEMGFTWTGRPAMMPACKSGSTALRGAMPTDEAVTCARCAARLAKLAARAVKGGAK